MSKILVFMFILIVILAVISVFKNEPVCIFSNDPIMCIQVSKIQK